MACPICDQKPMNCDCTPRERAMWRELQEREDTAEVVLTDAEREAIQNAIGWIESPSADSEAMPEDYLPITNTLRGLLSRCAIGSEERQVFLRENMTNDSAKPIKTAGSDRPQPIDITTRLRQTRANMLGTDDEQHYWDCHEAAAEIERLRTIMYRIVDEDCTVAIQGGKFYADDEPLFAISDTTKPRNGVVDTPDSQPTPGEGSTP